MRKNELRHRKGRYRLSFELKTLRKMQEVKSTRSLRLREKAIKEALWEGEGDGVTEPRWEEQKARETAGRFSQ